VKQVGFKPGVNDTGEGVMDKQSGELKEKEVMGKETDK